MAKNNNKIITYMITGLVITVVYIFILYLLNLFGIIIFVNRFSIFQEYIAELGGSIYFFSGNIILYAIACLMLSQTLSRKSTDYHEINFWNTAANLSVSLFFGIGVLYTAVGMQRAFHLTLGNINQDMATSMGPWGVLERLVNGGLLMALITTIVGGALGYTLRLIKFMVFGKKLIIIKNEHDNLNSLRIIEQLSVIENIISKKKQD